MIIILLFQKNSTGKWQKYTGLSRFSDNLPGTPRIVFLLKYAGKCGNLYSEQNLISYDKGGNAIQCQLITSTNGPKVQGFPILFSANSV